MSHQHLTALEQALGRKGWRIIAIHPGNDYNISASWEIRRRLSQESLFVDFYGLSEDGDICLPLAESYACYVRGREFLSLYFRKVNRSRLLWRRELKDFIQGLDSLAEG